MSRRHFRALTLSLLILLVAAPLSSGDKGLWLSLAPTQTQIFNAAARELPAEHAILVPEAGSRASRMEALLRVDRIDTVSVVGAVRALTFTGHGAHWLRPGLPAVHPHGEPSADRPASRAPPA